MPRLVAELGAVGADGLAIKSTPAQGPIVRRSSAVHVATNALNWLFTA